MNILIRSAQWRLITYLSVGLILGALALSTSAYAETVGSRLVCPDDYSAHVYDVTSADDAGPGTLRQAIIDSNQDGGPSLITFSGLGAGVHTIMVGSQTGGLSLPDVVEPVCIDGESAVGWVGATETTPAQLKVELDGTLMTTHDTSFPLPGDPQPFRNPQFFGVLATILASDTVVKGLSIGNTPNGTQFAIAIGEFQDTSNGGVNRGVQHIPTTTNVSIEGNHIGLDATGLVDKPVFAGIVIGYTQSIKMGGLDADDKRNVARNVFAGAVARSVTTDNTSPEFIHVLGNYFGKYADLTDVLSTPAQHITLVGNLLLDENGILSIRVPTKHHHIEGNILFRASNDLINLTFGGVEDVVIRNNDLEGDGVPSTTGIELGGGSQVVIENNRFINVALPMLVLGSHDNQIVNNIVSGGAPGGVFSGLVGAISLLNMGGNELIQGNEIRDYPGPGILISAFYDDVVGATTPGNVQAFLPEANNSNVIIQNTIRDNAGPGILIGSDLDHVVTDLCNTLRDNGITYPPFPNPFFPQSGGFWLCRQDAGFFNLIPVYYDGVTYSDVFDGSSKGNVIIENSIYGNGGLGIDNSVQYTSLPSFTANFIAAADGVTANDLDDADDGANDLQNYPVMQNISFNPAVAFMNANLNSTPNKTFRVDAYSNRNVDATGHGEGESWMGMKVVSTDANGNVSFSIPYNDMNQNAYVFDENGDTYITLTATLKENCNPDDEPGACKYGSTSEFSKACKINQADMVNKNVVDCTLQ